MSLASTKPTRSTVSIVPDEMSFAGYLLARAVDGRRVEGRDLDRLHLANDSMREARSLLAYGRPNVREDIESTSGESTRRVVAHRKLEDDPGLESTLLSRVIWSGAGTCGEHAQLTRASHATRMSQGEVASVVEERDEDHQWAESTPAEEATSRFPDPERNIVMDSWLDGPAVFESDSRLYAVPRSHRSPGSIITSLRYTNEQASVLEDAKRRAQDIALSRDINSYPSARIAQENLFDASTVVGLQFHNRVLRKLDREVTPSEAIKKGYRSSDTSLRDAMSSIRPFSSKASKRRAALSKASSSAPSRSQVREAERRAETAREVPARLRAEILATAVARDLAPQSSVRERTRQASSIVDAATTLRAPVARGHARWTEYDNA